MILIFISSGLFLGWSLGANDAANVFGSAVGSKMLKFRTAAIIASIFVIIGAVFQGQGATTTLNTLGKVDAIAGAFTVAFAAAITIYTASKYKLPVSTSQAIVGSIIGWNFYTGHTTDVHSLIKIVSSWFISPIVGALLAFFLYFLMKKFILKSKIHLILLDSYIRISLVILAAIGAYSLGANNIANVMGVFTNCKLPSSSLDFGIFTLNSTQQLFLIGGISVAAGIMTRSKQMIDSISNNLFKLSSEAALVVVLAEAIVLFIFSSHSLNKVLNNIGIPSIPLVPISSTQVMIGCILGVAIFKGGRGIKFSYLGQIGVGWIVSPIVAGVISFISLFFINNVFIQEVNSNNNRQIIYNQQTSKSQIISNAIHVSPTTEVVITKTIDIKRPFLLSISTLAILLFIYIIYEKQKLKSRRRNEMRRKLEQVHHSNQAVLKAELRSFQYEKEMQQKEKDFKRKYILNFGFSFLRNHDFLEVIKKNIETSKRNINNPESQEILDQLLLSFENNTFLENNRKEFIQKLDELNVNIYAKLEEEVPLLTEGEKRLLSMIYINLSIKDIAKLLRKSPALIKIYTMRLKRKLKMPQELDLNEYLQYLIGK